MTAVRRTLATHVTDARPVDTPLPSVVILRTDRNAGNALFDDCTIRQLPHSTEA